VFGVTRAAPAVGQAANAIWIITIRDAAASVIGCRSSTTRYRHSFSKDNSRRPRLGNLRRRSLRHCSRHNRRLGFALLFSRHEAELFDNDAQTGLAGLLRGCAGNDAGSFRQLYRMQAARLHGIALRITRHPTIAADVVHDTFVSIWEFAGTFDPARGSPEAWLISIVRHRALDTMRRQGRDITELREPVDEEPDSLARMLDSAAGAALHRCLAALEGDQRRLIVLAFLGGLSHSELADQLGSPLGTVKSSIRRGLASLRECLDA